MESTLSATTLFSMSKTLNSSHNAFISRLSGHFRTTSQSRCIWTQLAYLQLRRKFNAEFRASKAFGSASYSSKYLRSLSAVVVPPIGCVGSSAASFASGSGGGSGEIGGTGGGGGGDGTSDDANSAAGGSEVVSAQSTDVIILDVGGMTCGGCAASVKRILESQPQVSSASVNLATETAIVWPKSEAKVVPNWQKNLGEILAKHLTSCGFSSNPRGEEANE